MIYSILDEKMKPIGNPSITLSFLDVIYKREEKRKIVKEEILNQIKNKDLGTFQISDLTYNTLGGAVGGVIYYLGYSRKRKK